MTFTWESQDRRAKAVDLMDECVHLRIRILGTDDSDTLDCSAISINYKYSYISLGLAGLRFV